MDTLMTAPKPLHDTEATYRTPSGKLAFYSAVLAGTPEECAEEIQRRLRNEQRFGRRRVGTFLGVSCRHIGSQIPTS